MDHFFFVIVKFIEKHAGELLEKPLPAAPGIAGERERPLVLLPEGAVGL